MAAGNATIEDLGAGAKQKVKLPLIGPRLAANSRSGRSRRSFNDHDRHNNRGHASAFAISAGHRRQRDQRYCLNCGAHINEAPDPVAAYFSEASAARAARRRRCGPRRAGPASPTPASTERCVCGTLVVVALLIGIAIGHSTSTKILKARHHNHPDDDGNEQDRHRLQDRRRRQDGHKELVEQRGQEDRQGLPAAGEQPPRRR